MEYQSFQNSEIVIPGVKLKKTLGQGAFGVVYLGHHQLLDIEVAIKVINKNVATNLLDQALYEARLMARLDHPNLLRIHDAGKQDNSLYLVLEIMDGDCKDFHSLEVEKAYGFSLQLLSSLQALHDARILHRDIKPANCLIRQKDNRIKLADLGIATEFKTQTENNYDSAGTLPFMAPELFEEKPIFGPKSDLYALGLTLSSMFLDNAPFPTSSFGEILGWILNGQRPQLSKLRPDLPKNLTTVIEKMMSPKAEDRPETASEALALINSNSKIIVSRTQSTAQTKTYGPGIVGPWTLTTKIYESSNWRAYSASHTQTGASARVVFLQPNGPLADSTELILSSAERAASLEHKGVLDVLDWGKENDLAYVVTAPQGYRLEDLIKSSGTFNEFQALNIIVELANALTYLHNKGYVYQLVEPGSAMMTADARSSQLSWPIFCVPFGTPTINKQGKHQRVMVHKYAAPEAIYGKNTIEQSVDIYGLGEILYYLLNGKPAFPQQTTEQIAIAKTQPIVDIRELAPMTTAPTATLLSKMMDVDFSLRPNAVTVSEECSRIARRLKNLKQDNVFEQLTQKPL